MKNKELQTILSSMNKEAEVLFDVEGFYNENEFDALEIVAVEEIEDDENPLIILHAVVPIEEAPLLN